MRIPTAASMQSGIDDRFDRVLREATAATEAPAAPPAPLEREAPEDLDDAEVPQTSNKAARDDSDETPIAADETANGADEQYDVAQTADVTDNTLRGEPARQEAAGKGTDSPRTSHSAHDSALHDGPSLGTEAKATALPTAAPGTAPGATPATTVNRGSEPAIRGIDATSAASAANNTLRASRAQAGYATRSAAQAQLVEHARDSVFKQILLKLTPEGGEMRMRLEPPHLGELDLRLTMGEGNRLSLAIAAERGDVQQLLHRHLDELKQVLQQNGITVTDAEVQTQSQFARERDNGATAHGGAHHEDHAEDAASAPRPRGYVTAEGLDFWA